ncbi:MAG: [FeFe] hydrogenase H-cluster radical SAM maturase HydE [Armatimonadetes bacterium]|nr:[FeFe] hydrogenase H-cluster radical SAM maturase HydE [Armatimonadota bacterium]
MPIPHLTTEYLLEKACAEAMLFKDEIAVLLRLEDRAEMVKLFQAADSVRKRVHGDAVHLRGIIEFSNRCARQCVYCGLRAPNPELHRYRMEPEEIIEIARQAVALGYKTVVLQSGEDIWYDPEKMCHIIREIKAMDVVITLCMGEKSHEEYRHYREAGADRYLLKHETADPALYASLHPDMQFENRIRCLEWLRELGFQVGSGNMVGIPGQTPEILAEDILLMKRLDVEMAGIGPFIPNADTPLASHPRGNLDMTLKTLATARLLMPGAMLPATTATGTLDPFGRQKALKAGANVVMPNVTPLHYRQHYQIYPDKICLGEEPGDCRDCIQAIIQSLGRTVGTDAGHSPKVISNRPQPRALVRRGSDLGGL